ncbi:MAG: hypothetical protein A7315_00935 [Candidatus Altiarchaeales archaeon WOR_SM1_79]|nr:MAG: hypothetical protein A7315_00935 [Candidatus Altiarchaeales archaeon WOR_SM1_79]
MGGYDSLIGLDEAIGRYGAENIIRGMFNYLSDYISDAEDREDIFDKLKELIKTIDGVPTVLPPVMTSIPKPIVPESIKKPKEKNTGKE